MRTETNVLSCAFTTDDLLSVQCYASTEYKFTCEGVSVCVSVTLSGQTHQRIFTVDSSKDADLRKDVPFEGLDDK